MKTTNKNETAPKKKLSIPTIVVLAVGGVLIVYMLVQPLVIPKEQRSDNPVTKVRTANNPAQAAPVSAAAQSAPGSKAMVVPDRAALADVAVKTAKGKFISGRDPFMPSPVLIRAAVEPIPAPVVFPERPPAPTIVKTQPEITSVPAVTASPDRFAWKGVVGSYGEQQVVIIQHNVRSYILHQGEPVPGTKYIVAEVTPDMVVLTSPDKELRLSKKKEAKTNGKE
jgi:hypothetical protein